LGIEESKKGDWDRLYLLINKEYLTVLGKLLNRFKNWTPEAYIHIEKGIVYAIFANCDLIINLWDNDVEKMSEENVDEFTYQERLKEWTETIKLLLNDNTIKKVFE